ncbi:MAG: sugar phosphate isomerase/epimerase [Proteobacteria bacterium]|nr:sugar phosphate isomerase/epimerase [Pseudomonadota bacterium]MBU1586072.1 sugar phosphate isomerase/epimerase [Pseudomonadota bacterium]MBU2453228.1 sugar phosphate isomerase/epimerase [Pseudomonadota bacterium]MBU2628321.1 sugar phosphate isomerase/epimerase [Pseudomonadota bacterium]
MPDKRSKDSTLHGRPFKLGTTSFIFPDHIIPNVKKLGPLFDEIELLVFESQAAGVLPSKDEVKELLYLSGKLDLTYNIHLPIDVSLTCGSLKKRQKAVDTLLAIIDLFAPLAPTTHTLHLEMPKDIRTDERKLEIWREETRQSLNTLLSELASPGILSIETLDYPFAFLDTLVEQLNLSVCIDAGHQIKYGFNLIETFEKHKSRTSIIHLHGVDFSGKNIKDHTSLDKLPEKYLGQVQTILEKFTGVVSLEVFNLENLNRSLAVLSKMFKHMVP